MELSPEGSEEVPKDFDDEQVMKTKVFDSDDASDDEPDTKSMGTHFRPLLSLLLLFFLLFLVRPFICLACYLIMQSQISLRNLRLQQFLQSPQPPFLLVLVIPFFLLFFLLSCPFLFFISLPEAYVIFILRSIAYWEDPEHHI